MVTNSNSYARGHLWGCNHRGGLPCCSETEVCGSPADADRLPAAPCLLWRRNVVRDSKQCAPSNSWTQTATRNRATFLSYSMGELERPF